MKRCILLPLFFLPLLTHGQTTLPNWVIDSLLYESNYARACDTLQRKQAYEIQTVGFELLQTQHALKLQKRQTSDCDTLVNLANQKADLIQRLGDLENRKLRKDKRKLLGALGLAILYGALKTF